MTNELKQFMMHLGLTPEKQGFTYLGLAVNEMDNNPRINLRNAYKNIASYLGANICTIDSSIRNVIHYAYESKKLMRLNAAFGSDVIGDRCPTNKELISILTCYRQFKIN